MIDANHQSRKLIRLLGILLLTVFAPAPGQAGELVKEGSFEGDWAVEGTSQSVEMEGARVSVYQLEGPANVTNADTGMAREFQTRCVGVSDEKTGGVGRCIWADEDDDQLFMEMGGTIAGPDGKTREALGLVVGGTGKYAGIGGAFQVEWLFWESAFEEGKIAGRDTKFNGSWVLP
ncbi:MAG: hypothetical protein OES47_12760 [Acidobacteriota bacterium]|nr:hypothetical protein [Acidobacteriota bacterium]